MANLSFSNVVFYLYRIAITQIVIGGMSIVFGIGIVCVPDRLIYRLQNQLLGTGIWDGLLFVITGIIGLSAANRNVRKKVRFDNYLREYNIILII